MKVFRRVIILVIACAMLLITPALAVDYSLSFADSRIVSAPTSVGWQSTLVTDGTSNPFVFSVSSVSNDLPYVAVASRLSGLQMNVYLNYYISQYLVASDGTVYYPVSSSLVTSISPFSYIPGSSGSVLLDSVGSVYFISYYPTSVLADTDTLTVFWTNSFASLSSIPSAPGAGDADPTSLLGQVAQVSNSVLDYAVRSANTVVTNPFLLLTVGFLFLGGVVAIFGRLLSRR